MIFMSAFQKWEMNSLSLLLTMLASKPFLQYQSLKNINAKSSALMSMVVGMIRMSAPSWSVINSMQLYPPSSGNGLMKSMAMLLPHSSRTGRGCNSPGVLVVCDVFLKHSVQEGM